MKKVLVVTPVSKYQATDGTLFDTQPQCEEYEAKLSGRGVWVIRMNHASIVKVFSDEVEASKFYHQKLKEDDLRHGFRKTFYELDFYIVH
jgi:hypothetical protein